MKRYLGVLGAIVIAAGVAINVGISSNGSSLSYLALANIEALARNEGNDCDSLTPSPECMVWKVTYYTGFTCSTGDCWKCPL